MHDDVHHRLNTRAQHYHSVNMLTLPTTVDISAKMNSTVVRGQELTVEKEADKIVTKKNTTVIQWCGRGSGVEGLINCPL